MKKYGFIWVLSLGLIVFFGAAGLISAVPTSSQQSPAATKPPQQTGSPSSGGDGGWPREIKSGDTTFKIHQPQLESWDGVLLQALVAIEVRAAGSDKPSYGGARVSARTEVDKVDRVVTLNDVKVLKVLFPSAPDKQQAYLETLQKNVIPKARLIALDRLEAELAIMEAEKKIDVAVPIKNDPPRIIFSTVPAILVYIDGDPVYRPVKDTKLQRVINTRPLILKDSAGKHFLHLFDGWLEAASINGPWTVSQLPAKDLDKALKDAVAGGQVDLLEGEADPEKKEEKPTLAKGPVPTITVATSATELIVTEGEPKYVAIPGTSLLYAENTTGHLFKHSVQQNFYVLISGRWFGAVTVKGPWEFVPYGKLPPDFAKIPDDSPKENVKASVPDTPQAKEAVIANHIPQTAEVNRKTAKLNTPQFDGKPQFKPIDGTTLQSAVNTATPIIRVDAKTFYAVENGIWFKASSVEGPWAVADSVPTAIYTIPPSSSLHFVTYVKVYSSDAETVNVGYTPGYYGTCVTHGSGFVVVYGTGYHYAPWVGAVWFGPPMTYGFGCSMCYTPWTGWAVGFGFGWHWGVPMAPVGWGWGMYPWWGPVGWGHYYPYPYYHPPYGWYGGAAWGVRGAAAWGPGGWAATTGNVYHRYGSTGAVTRTSQGYNAYTGNRWANQVGMSYNSKTGNLAAGQRAAVGNVYTGNYAYGSRGAVTNPDTGRTVSGGQVTGGNVRTGDQTSAAWIRGEQGGAAKVGDDIYAGKDGTVYRKGDNGWEQNSGSGWGSADSAQPKTSATAQNKQSSASPKTSQLDSQQKARAQGQARSQGFSSGAYRSAGRSTGRRR
jgi:hypothetical protein